MSKQVMVRDPSGTQYEYTIIESLEDIGEVFCFAPVEDLISIFNDGETIMVNRMGGYCFFTEDYHTIVN